MQPAINVQRVSKRFNKGERFDSFRDLLGGRLLKSRVASQREDEFYAVHDVSFHVDRGEAFGIIGPNGAGKSTLLKLLARIMPPDAGRIDVLGRVSALIELGAGFHPDLTGRENIFLNASILGMPRREVRRKFGEIVEFAGIGDFLETPVKRYSSGMYARLGFAIAVHVEPNILLVDEVLSVGDRVFRAKCMDKMREFLRRGVAVVFVSHDLASVQRFCDRAMVIAKGEESFCGPATQAVGQYWASSTPAVRLDDKTRSPVHVTDMKLHGSSGMEQSAFEPGDSVRLGYDVHFDIAMERPSFGLSLIRMDDHQPVFETSSTRLGLQSGAARPGQVHHVSYDFILNVTPGLYAVGLHVRERDATTYAVHTPYAIQIIVESDPVTGGTVHLAPRVTVSTMVKGRSVESSQAVEVVA
jgi:lipopolysaccharide transport system ATP-binding protein